MFCGLYAHVYACSTNIARTARTGSSGMPSLAILHYCRDRLFVCLCSGATTVDYCTCTQPRVQLQLQVSIYNTRIVMTGHFSET